MAKNNSVTGVRRRGKGWVYYIHLGRGADNKKKNRMVGGFATQAAAKAARAKALTMLHEDADVAPSKETIADYLKEWVAGAARTRVRPSTWASYKINIERHIIPGIGAKRLQGIKPDTINDFYAHLLENGRVDGNGGLSQQTVKYIAMILKHVLADAVKSGRIVRNPADGATPPRPRNVREMQTWTGDQVRAFLEHVRDDDMYAAYVVSAMCGTRRGETLGLRWADVDLERGRISIAQTNVTIGYRREFSTPKTTRGRRTISLDPTTIDALRRHRTRQLERRLAIGADWRDFDLVFARADGAPIHPERLTRSFDRHVKAAGLPRIRLHDLRHTNASLMLSAGVPAKVASERLGHGSVGITLDTYSHVVPGMQEEAAATIGTAVFGA